MEDSGLIYFPYITFWGCLRIYRKVTKVIFFYYDWDLREQQREKLISRAMGFYFDAWFNSRDVEIFYRRFIRLWKSLKLLLYRFMQHSQNVENSMSSMRWISQTRIFRRGMKFSQSLFSRNGNLRYFFFDLTIVRFCPFLLS